jgi:hypothetical protein
MLSLEIGKFGDKALAARVISTEITSNRLEAMVASRLFFIINNFSRSRFLCHVDFGDAKAKKK